MGCVDQLARLVGLPRRVQRGFDWATIEGSLGLKLPSEYKELAETFPSGEFQHAVKLIRPGDVDGDMREYLGYFAYRLQDMRAWRQDQPERFPFAIYPEQGGLLPWAWTTRAGLLFWRTTGDCEEWPIVVADPTFDNWRTFQRSACEFLIDLVTNSIEDARSLGMDVSAGNPVLAIHQAAPLETSSSGKSFWKKMRGFASGSPRNDMPALRALLSDCGREGSPTLDWDQVHRQLGTQLPADYREFVDTFGAGIYRDLRIMAPGVEAADLSMFLVQTRERASVHQRRPGKPPFYPDQDGLIAWGATSDGWTCGWGPLGNPEEWGVALVNPRFKSVDYLPDVSFSSFLLKYAEPGNRVFIGRDVSHRELPLFQPY